MTTIFSHRTTTMTTTTDLDRLRRDAIRSLSDVGVPTPEADAELLIGSVLGCSRGELQAAAVLGRQVSPDDSDGIADAILRRTRREPLQHITGRAYFRDIELHVGPGVFVPRPETEVLVELGVREVRARLQAEPTNQPRVLDLGTGSGAIALAVATEIPTSDVVAVEASATAFTWAEENRRRLGVENVSLIFGDLATACSDYVGTVDVILSNPPYVPTGAIPRDPEVRMFDPETALYSGHDGLNVIRTLVELGATLLVPGGLIAVEHGESQAAEIRELFTRAGWTDVETVVDLSGRDRVTSARTSAAA